jgi:CRISPR/Cas system-associated protein Cas10 (large subunit of type III CRISPR-Cas system)
LVEAIGKERLASASHLPFEIIAIGGDDVTVIVPAPYGWLLAVKLLQKFEEHTQIQRLHQGMGTKLTIAAGLVIADVKYPVSFMQRLAEGLLKDSPNLLGNLR